MKDQQSEQKTFDIKQFEEGAVEQLRSGKPLEGKDGVLVPPVIRRLVEASLAGEMDVHLQQPADSGDTNRRNGKMSKRVRDRLRHRADRYAARPAGQLHAADILPRRQTVPGEALDHKVISLYGKGMSYTDICTHLEDLYGLVVSPASLTAITHRVPGDVRAWQSRTLESGYTIVWLGCYSLQGKGRRYYQDQSRLLRHWSEP